MLLFEDEDRLPEADGVGVAIDDLFGCCVVAFQDLLEDRVDGVVVELNEAPDGWEIVDVMEEDRLEDVDI